MVEKLWPLALIALAAAVAIGLSASAFLKIGIVKSKKLTIAVSLVAIVLTVIPSIYSSLSAPALTAYATCQSSSEFAPATVTCIADVSSPASVVWKIDGKTIDDGSTTIQEEIKNPGKVVVQLDATEDSYIRKSMATFSTSVVLQEPKPIPPEVITVVRSFSEMSREPRRFTVVFSADPGYEIIDASLSIDSSKNVYDIGLDRSPSSVVVHGMLKPEFYFRGFSPKFGPAIASGTVTLTEQAR